MASIVEQASRLIDEAARRRVVLMVDHTFVYTGAVRKMRELVATGRTRRHLLLRLGAHQPRPVPARRERDLGPRRARSVDHGLRAAEQPMAVSATGLAHVPRRAGEHRLHDDVLRRPADRARPRELAGAGEGAADAARRQPAHDGLRRSRAEREDQGLRQRHLARTRARRTSTRCSSAIAPATCGRRSWR